MRYRNIKTQAVIETACAISGGDWVVDEPTVQSEPATQPKRKTIEKKGGGK